MDVRWLGIGEEADPSEYRFPMLETENGGPYKGIKPISKHEVVRTEQRDQMRNFITVDLRNWKVI